MIVGQFIGQVTLYGDMFVASHDVLNQTRGVQMIEAYV